MEKKKEDWEVYDEWANKFNEGEIYRELVKLYTFKIDALASIKAVAQETKDLVEDKESTKDEHAARTEAIFELVVLLDIEKEYDILMKEIDDPNIKEPEAIQLLKRAHKSLLQHYTQQEEDHVDKILDKLDEDIRKYIGQDEW